MSLNMLKCHISRHFRSISLQMKGHFLKVDLGLGKTNCTPLHRFSEFNPRQSVSLQQQKHRNIMEYNKKFLHNLRNEEKPKPTITYTFSKISGAISGAIIIASAGLLGYRIARGLPLDMTKKNKLIENVVQKAGPAVVSFQKQSHPFKGVPTTYFNGAGFIVRSNGVILTNAHVVANKSTVSVKLQDGRVMEGQVTAVDPISELAIVKIDANNLPTIPLAASSTVSPDEFVVALGSPLSLSYAGTCGIECGEQDKCKELGLLNTRMDYIGTDAYINSRNSGGPLVNKKGEAIGINTMRGQGRISFATPSDYALKFLLEAEDGTKNDQREVSTKQSFGVIMSTLTDDLITRIKQILEEYGKKMPDLSSGGVIVRNIIPGTPAHIAGILPRDIIIEINGFPIKSPANVHDAVEKSDLLKVTLFRRCCTEKKVITVDTKQTF